MKNLSHSTFLGKKVSHIDAVRERLVDIITHIITQEQKISEKDFKRYDAAINEAKNIVTKDMVEMADTYLQDNRRIELLAEMIYDKSRNGGVAKEVMTFEKYNNK